MLPESISLNVSQRAVAFQEVFLGWLIVTSHHALFLGLTGKLKCRDMYVADYSALASLNLQLLVHTHAPKLKPPQDETA